jgi:hypothetical protein
MKEIYFTTHFVAPCSLLSGATAPLATHPIYATGYNPSSPDIHLPNRIAKHTEISP